MARTLKCDTIIHHQGSSANIALGTNLTDFGSIDVNIDGGNIDGVTIGTSTIGTSNITVPSNKTLNVEQGTFTTSETQKNDILNGSSALVLTNINTSTNYADVEVTGDLKVTGNNILSSGTGTALTLTNANVAVGGELTVTGNKIKSSGTGTALTLSNEDVTVGGDLTVSGNDIKGGNATMNFQPDGTNTEMSIDTSGNLTIEGEMTVKGGKFLNTTNSTSGSTKSFEFSTKHNGSQAVKMSLEHDGDLIVAGDITAFGTPSDENMKNNITDYHESAMALISQMSVKTFLYKPEYQDHAVREGTQIGLIAQAVEKNIPEAVKTKEDGMKTIQYEVLVAILIKALQEVYQQGIPMLTAQSSAIES